MLSHENAGRAGSIEQEPIHTLDQTFSSLDCEFPPTCFSSWARSAPAADIPDIESTLQTRENIRQIVAVKAASEHIKRYNMPRSMP